MSAKEDLVFYGAVAAVAGIGVYLVWRNLGAIGSAASNAAGSAIQSAGSMVGIPRTDQALCEAAIASDNLTDVSKFCDAGTFLRASGYRLRGLGLDGRPKVGPVLDQTDAESRRLGLSSLSAIDSDTSIVYDPASPYTTTGDDRTAPSPFQVGA